MKVDLKNPNIAVAVSMVVVVIGAVLFHDAGEAAMQLVGVLGFVVMLATLFALEARDERREPREGKEPQ